MKKLALILIIILLPLIAQDTDTPNTNVSTGTILEKEGTRINYNEAWLKIGGTPVSSKTAMGGAKRAPLVITDKDDKAISYNDLIAPCLVELTFIYENDDIVPIKIKVLEQYSYDSNGFIDDDVD